MKARKPFHMDSVDIKAGGAKAEERTGGIEHWPTRPVTLFTLREIGWCGFHGAGSHLEAHPT